MKAQELRESSVADLQKQLNTTLKERMVLRMRRGIQEEVKTHQFRALRRDIARIRTVLHQKQQAGE